MLMEALVQPKLKLIHRWEGIWVLPTPLPQELFARIDVHISLVLERKWWSSSHQSLPQEYLGGRGEWRAWTTVFVSLSPNTGVGKELCLYDTFWTCAQALLAQSPRDKMWHWTNRERAGLPTSLPFCLKGPPAGALWRAMAQWGEGIVPHRDRISWETQCCVYGDQNPLGILENKCWGRGKMSSKA